MSCWQSAPADIICDIGERLLDTNDLDAYVAMRGVCTVWRQAIAPLIERGEQGDIEILRVRPHRWIVLDEDVKNEITEVNNKGVDRCLVNLSTGWMVNHHLSIFNDHIFVGSSDGLLILIGKDKPYLPRLWEPFTGYHVQFAAGVINDLICHYAVETRGVPRLFCVHGFYYNPRVMCYDIDNGGLEVLFGDMPVGGVMSMTAYKSDVFVYFTNRRLFKITGTGHAVHGELILIHMGPEFSPDVMRQHLLVSEDNLLLVVIDTTQLAIIRVDIEQRTAERIYNLGSQTLFLGMKRCISVNADKFSAAGQNCLYQVCISPDTTQIQMVEYSLLSARKHEIDEPFTNYIFSALGTRPFSMAQVLMHYCIVQDRRKTELLNP